MICTKLGRFKTLHSKMEMLFRELNSEIRPGNSVSFSATPRRYNTKESSLNKQGKSSKAFLGLEAFRRRRTPWGQRMRRSLVDLEVRILQSWDSIIRISLEQAALMIHTRKLRVLRAQHPCLQSQKRSHPALLRDKMMTLMIRDQVQIQIAMIPKKRNVKQRKRRNRSKFNQHSLKRHQQINQMSKV